ncbi:MAG TPA: hypothetical protein VN285_10320 [Candidatus Deferrimicrobium sp.]|nr:hypothetical protein [Candidatus Deferrimicrobium sp.]
MNTTIDNSSGQTDSGYESRDVNATKIILGGIGIIAVIVVIVVLLAEYFVVVKEEQTYEAVLKPESSALRDLRAREDEMLTSYGVVDSAAGVYRIPVSRAMELLADEAYREKQKR